MPQVNPIVLTDGTNPKTFQPSKVDQNAVRYFVNRDLGRRDLESTVTVQTKDASNNSQVISMQLKMPHIITNADTGEQYSDEESFVQVKIRHAAIASSEDRDYLLALVADALRTDHTQLGSVTTGDEGFY